MPRPGHKARHGGDTECKPCAGGGGGRCTQHGCAHGAMDTEPNCLKHTLIRSAHRKMPPYLPQT
eukprot:14409889-Alexandrium_andersonii.AAC.1